jgi:hypothetical protein
LPLSLYRRSPSKKICCRRATWFSIGLLRGNSVRAYNILCTADIVASVEIVFSSSSRYYKIDDVKLHHVNDKSRANIQFPHPHALRVNELSTINMGSLITVFVEYWMYNWYMQYYRARNRIYSYNYIPRPNYSAQNFYENAFVKPVSNNV